MAKVVGHYAHGWILQNSDVHLSSKFFTLLAFMKKAAMLLDALWKCTYGKELRATSS